MRHFEWFSNIVSNAIFIFYYPEEIPHPSIKRQKVFLCCQNFVIPQCRFDIYDRKNMGRVAWESICWRKFVFTTSKCGLDNTKQTGRRKLNLFSVKKSSSTLRILFYGYESMQFEFSRQKSTSEWCRCKYQWLLRILALTLNKKVWNISKYKREQRLEKVWKSMNLRIFNTVYYFSGNLVWYFI